MCDRIDCTCSDCTCVTASTVHVWPHTVTVQNQCARSLHHSQHTRSLCHCTVTARRSVGGQCLFGVLRDPFIIALLLTSYNCPFGFVAASHRSCNQQQRAAIRSHKSCVSRLRFAATKVVFPELPHVAAGLQQGLWLRNCRVLLRVATAGGSHPQNPIRRRRRNIPVTKIRPRRPLA